MAYSAAFSQAVEILISIELKSRETCLVQYLTIQKIAEGLSIPVPSVKRLVGMLRKAQLVTSKKGVAGGLALARPVNEVNLYEVLIAVEGSTPLFEVYENFDFNSIADEAASRRLLARGKLVLEQIETEMHSSLKAQTLADLLTER